MTSSKKGFQLPPDESDHAAELVKIDDLQSVEILASFSNTTSNSTTIKPGQTRVLELDEHGLALEVPEKCCSVGHNAMIEIQIPKFNIVFKATAKVEAIEGHSGHKDLIQLKLVQFPEDVWAEMNKKLNQRREEIEQFLTAAKG